MEFEHHTVVLLRRPDRAPALPEEAAARLRHAHLAHQAGLVEQGHVIAAGPLVGPDDDPATATLCVLVVAPEVARELFHEDPAVRAGQLTVEVLTWAVPAGNVRFHGVPLAPSALEPGTA